MKEIGPNRSANECTIVHKCKRTNCCVSGPKNGLLGRQLEEDDFQMADTSLHGTFVEHFGASHSASDIKRRSPF